MARGPRAGRIAVSLAVVVGLLATLLVSDSTAAPGSEQPLDAGGDLSQPGAELVLGGDAAELYGVFGEAWNIIQKYYLVPSAAEPRHLLLSAVTGLTQHADDPDATLAALKGGFDRSKVDLRPLMYDAIRSMVQSLHDPTSVYLTPDERRVAITGFEGHLEGIGACLDVGAGQVLVRGVVEGGPAAQSGLRAGDLVLAVDGQPVEGRSVQDVILGVRGPSGTLVRLTTSRPSAATGTELTIQRADIRLISANGKMVEPSIGILRLSAFTEGSDAETGAVLDDLSRSGARGLVIDLRGNLGGLLEPTVAVASRFIGTTPIVWQENNHGQRFGYERVADEPLVGWPLVVLIDRNSASASEVLALVLRDAGRARLVGTPTYGKGTIQYLFELSDGSGLHLTSARWVSPSGSRLEPTGLTPDITVSEPRTDQDDPATRQAVGLLRQVLPGSASGPLALAPLPADECTPRSASAA